MDTIQAPGRCRSCSTLAFDFADLVDDRIPLAYAVRDTLPDLPFLTENSKLGCEFCWLLSSEIQRIARDQNANHPGEIRLQNVAFVAESELQILEDKEANGVYRLEIDLTLQLIDLIEVLNFSVSLDSNDPSASLKKIYRHRLPDDPISEQTLSKIQHWISDCQEDHFDCNVWSRNDFSPTRLLHVPSSDRMDSSISLVEAPYSHSPRYAALSHCWGRRALFTTTQATLDQRKQTISLNELPKNFADAITVCHKLRIDYLWIDSICIIQDSPVDWQTQSSMMDDVYKHAYITIAATNAKSAYDGFLERPAIQEARVPYISPTNGMIDGLFYLRPIERSRRLSSWEADVEDSTWNERGWTLQERYLSRRLVHFCIDRLYFECRIGLKCEDNGWIPNATLPAVIPTDMDHDAQSSHEDTSEDSNGTSTEDDVQKRADYKRRVLSHWYNIIARYTPRVLTKSSDKFPAISGLAKEMPSASDMGRYVAGLWTCDIAYGLLWYSNPDFRDPELASGPYRAPSWSWASFDTRVVWSIFNEEIVVSLVELVEENVIVSSVNPYGEVKEGSEIVIHGGLFEGEIRGSEGLKEDDRDVWERKLRYELWYTGTRIGIARLDVVLTRPLKRSVSGVHTIRQTLHTTRKQSEWTGLLLESVCNESERFRRIGVFALDAAHDDTLEEVMRRHIKVI